MLDKKVVIDEITVAGNSRTSLSFFKAELNEFNQSKTLHESSIALEKFTDRLLNLDMFEAVDTNLHITSEANEIYHSGLIINVKEKDIPTLNMQSYIKSGLGSEIGFELQGALRNPLGFGEKVKFTSNSNHVGSKQYLCSLSCPNVGPMRAEMVVALKSMDENQSTYTSFKQKINSLSVELTSRDHVHQIIGEYAMRDEIPVQRNNTSSTGCIASAVTTHTATPSLKTSLKYSCTPVDCRDSVSNPSKGSLLQGSVELALPLGTAQFIRTELNVQQHYTLGPALMGQPGLVASLSGSLGVLKPFSFTNNVLTASRESGTTTLPAASGRHGITFLSDRYQLGGPNSLRGFEVCGTGPRTYQPTDSNPINTTNATSPAFTSSSGDNNAALGGDTRSTLLAMLSVPVPMPLLATSKVRAFLFANGGSIQCFSPSSSSSAAMPLFGHLRASIGGGFSVSVANAMRLEATYAIPVIKALHDKTRHFQLGVGLTIN